MSLAHEIKHFGSTLISNKTSAFVATAATAAVTYAGHNVVFLAPIFKNTLLGGGVFGLVTNRIAIIAHHYLPDAISNKKIRGFTSYCLGGAAATALSFGAVKMGVSVASVTPAGALTLTIVAIVAHHFSPQVKHAVKTVFVNPLAAAWHNLCGKNESNKQAKKPKENVEEPVVV